MARRPKRTYNQATGKWEVEKLWDYRDDDGYYWKDGVQVDNSGRPIYDAQGNEQGAAPADENNVTLNPTDMTIDKYDPRNLITTDQGEIRPHPSQAEEDYYAALDAGEDPKITQAHLDEIAPGAGQMYVSDFYDEGPRRQSFQPGSEPTTQAGSMRRIIQDKSKGATSTRNIAPSLLNRKASANA